MTSKNILQRNKQPGKNCASSAQTKIENLPLSNFQNDFHLSHAKYFFLLGPVLVSHPVWWFLQKQLFAAPLLFLNLFFPYRLCQSVRETPNGSIRVGNGEYWKVHFAYQDDYKELDFIIWGPVTFISKAFYYVLWYVLSW